MATITTDTFLDGGTSLTAGEAWTMNGGVLTIRTDTRWHVNAPAGMLGSIGATTTSATLGGGVLLDARNVRWMPYNTGSGTVPAIGTTITQGGVSGYLLGVWASLTSAPSAVGAAMPATGFLKFREVTGGSFAAGALTGISASAVSADVAGWIEVVQDQAVANTVPRLGFYRTRGDWFELGTTTGTAGQIVQTPTNGGGAGTLVPAVWIETGVGTNVYEIFPAVSSASFIAANLSTDQRSKFVRMGTNGEIRIGGDGTTAIGFLPPAGCRVRIPNVIGRQTSAANRALNLVPNATLATRPDFTTTSAGEIDFEYFMNDWYHLFTSAFKVRMLNCATFDIHSTSNEASPTELDNYVTAPYQGGSISFTGLNSPLGGEISNCKFFRLDAASNGHPLSMTGCSNHVFTNTHHGVITYARSSGGFTLSQCRNLVFNNLNTYAVAFNAATCANITVNDINYTDRMVGTTIATTPFYVSNTTVSCDNIIIDGVTFGFGITNVHPYNGILASSNCSNITLRNAGTPASTIGGATNAPANIFVDSGNNDGVRIQNCSLTATRTGLYTTANTSKNMTFENLRSTVGAVVTAGVNTQGKGLRAASNSVVGQASVYGSHWFDMFYTDTTGGVWLAFNEPTAFSADQYELVVGGTGFGFTSAGQVVMPNVGDQIIFTMPYFCLGHTAFANAAATLTGTNTGNFTYEYRLDTGTGFAGAWKTLNGANLSAETISAVTGFRLQFRMTTTVANTGNALTYVRINTVSTLLAQQGNLYPQDYATIALTGLVAGSRVQLYDTTNSAELFNAVVAGTSLTYATPYTADFNVRVRVMNQSGVTAYELVEFTEAVTLDGVSRAVTQVLDTVYNLNAIDGSAVTGITIDDGALLVNFDTPTISWSQIYAYETYWLMTEEGIRDESRFMEAIDPANYTLTDFKIKNTSFPTAPLTITGGWGRDSVTGETVTLIDTSGGTIFSNPDLVIAFETSGGGGGGATAAEVWSYVSRTLTSGGGGGLDAAGVRAAIGMASANLDTQLAALPTATENATQVRTELTTELARIDVATSTRLATAGYIAPDNAGIAAIPTNPLLASDARLNNLDATVSSRLATSGYTAPDNASITAILTDTGTTIPAQISALNDFDPATEQVIVATNNDKTGYGLANNAITASVVATNALNNSSFTTGYFNAINAEVDTALADYDAPTKAEMDVGFAAIVAPDNASIAAIKVKTDNLPADPADESSIQAAIAAIPAAPSATTVAAAVRTELATELARMDATISSRLAAVTYVAPDNVGIAAIPTNPLLTDDARLNNLDVAISTRALETTAQESVSAAKLAAALSA